MKDVSGTATSQSTSFPWTGITQTNAKTACTNLGNICDLISNPEWMTKAYEIEKAASNWGSGVVGLGSIYIGHSETTTNLEITDTNDPFVNTENNPIEAMGSGKEHRRTLILSNGDVIWDFSVNAIEWVD